MQLSYTKNTLKKLEQLFDEQEFEIRYERGHFQSGYCIVSKKNIILISKFFNTQARIESLIEILSQINIKDELMTANSKKLVISIIKYNQAA